MQKEFEFESMGCGWKITVWDEDENALTDKVFSEIERMATDFDKTYSRFKKDSLVNKIALKEGDFEVPNDLTAMLRPCFVLNELSKGRYNPLVGRAIEDTGYDSEYTLTPKKWITDTPLLKDALEILSDTKIKTFQKVLIDIGSFGKGYFVDIASGVLKQNGFNKFLVNGSGDIYYSGNNEPLVVGLEHPLDFNKVIGSLKITGGGVCASATNRRSWGEYNHILDPVTKTSPKDILATWVLSENAFLADAIATYLFLDEPESLNGYFNFEFLMLNKDLRVKKSSGFEVELY
jgi:thiamine biosynthesis lipoprotein